jgi:hypothetical protein
MGLLKCGRHLIVASLVVATHATNLAHADQKIDTINAGDYQSQVQQSMQSPLSQYQLSTFRDHIPMLLIQTWSRGQMDPGFHLGALKVTEMFGRFKNAVLVNNSTHSPIVADQDRQTDFYLVNQNLAVLNQDFYKGDSTSQGAILLHVLLGASGYQDENYNLTLLLFQSENLLRTGGLQALKRSGIIALFPKTNETLFRSTGTDPSKNVTGQRSQNERLIIAAAGSGGGGTGVGGGGDGFSSEMKVHVLDNLDTIFSTLPVNCRELFHNSTVQFEGALISTEIESSPEASQPKIVDSGTAKFKIVLPRLHMPDPAIAKVYEDWIGTYLCVGTLLYKYAPQSSSH